MQNRLILCLLAGLASLAVLAGDPLVTRAQNRLYQLGYPPGPIDGVMGPRTRQAIDYFQGDHDIPRTGTLNDETLSMLKLNSKRYEAPAPVLRLQAFLESGGYYSGKIDGLIGRRTWRAMQAYLRDEGYYKDKVDGIAGPLTRNAVAAWQQSLGVKPTRILDGATIAALLGTPIGRN